VKPNARSVALELLLAVEHKDAYANLILPKLVAKAKLSSQDSALCQELAFGTLRSALFYDFAIEAAAKREIDDIDIDLLWCLRMGAHQLLSMRIPNHAALNETVELVKIKISPKVSGFANSVLRRISETNTERLVADVARRYSDNDERLSATYSHPLWIVKALKLALAADSRESELESLLRSNNAAAAVNLVKLPSNPEHALLDEAMLTPSRASLIGYELESGNPADLRDFAAGTLRVQDAGSQLSALALIAATPILKDERWLDLCAGPGGKAALLAAEAQIHGASLIANEIMPHRAELVRQALSSTAPATRVTSFDGRQLSDQNLGKFSRILVDAPCTGLGALRRRPEARYRKSSEDLKVLTKLQIELVLSAYSSLAAGGVLAYVTCSPHLSETTAVVAAALKQTDATLLDAREALRGQPIFANLPANRKTVQLFTDRDQTDCMFIALLQRPE
jgi:16S rRNA (cytosine967-C5)-methyltransferase